MMVRNAVRVITLTIFKLNDEKINSLLEDLPFCSYFCHLALTFRDKTLEIDSSYCGNKKSSTYDHMFHAIEDLQDLFEFFHEIFEIENETVN